MSQNDFPKESEGGLSLYRISKFAYSEGKENIVSEIDSGLNEEISYVRRKRIPNAIREYIWSTTNARCYLCKTFLPKKSAWHIEHVLAFSCNPEKHDVIGNMLPACQSCNLRKNNKSLVECIQYDLSYDIMTEAKDLPHLNSEAKNQILVALSIKHNRNEINESDIDLLDEFILSKTQSKGNNSIDEWTSSFTQSNNAFESAHKIDRLCITDFDFHEDTSLKAGGFGEIYKATYTRSDSETLDIAIKIPLSSKSNDSLIQELECLKKFNHENIVKFYGWTLVEENPQTGSIIGIVLEWCNYSLDLTLPQRRVDPFKTIVEVALALEHLHSFDIVHRDIKPHNILICKPMGVEWSSAVAKLCDFGCAKECIFNKASMHTYNAGTAAYRAPEIKNSYLYPSSDTYSLGHIMHDLLHANNNFLTGDCELAKGWESLANQMIEKKPVLRPPLPQIVLSLHHLKENKKLPDLNYKISNVTMRSKLQLKSNPMCSIAEDSDGYDTATDGINFESPKQNSFRKIDGDDDDVDVYVAITAQSRQQPKGAKYMKYHKEYCGILSVSYCIDISEAEEFSHTPCGTCYQRKNIKESTKELVTSNQKGRKMWTDDEVEALLKGMSKHKVGNWIDIKNDPEFSERLHERNNNDLRYKYTSLLCSQDVFIKTKLQSILNFSDEVSELNLVSPSSSKKEVSVSKSKNLPSCNSAQKGRRKWTAEEVEALLEGVEKHKEGNWIKILKDPILAVKFNSDRDHKDLRYKYRNLLKNKENSRNAI